MTRQPGRGASTSARCRLGEWSSADWTFDAARGGAARPLRGHAPPWPATASRPRSFLVAAYRRPEFRVDVEPRRRDARWPGVGLKGVVAGRYLFGAPMAGRPVRWTYSTRAALRRAAARSRTRFPEERYAFLDEEREDRGTAPPETLQAREAHARRAGPARPSTSRPTATPAGPTSTRSKARSPTSRGRRSPAAPRSAWIPRPGTSACAGPPYFADAEQGLDTEVVAVGPRRASRRPACRSTVTLTQVQWHARAPRRGRRLLHLGDRAREVAGRGRGRSPAPATPVPLHVPLPRRRLLRAAGDGQRRGGPLDHARAVVVLRRSAPATRPGSATTTTASTSCRRRRRYRPGETARIMIKSPWERRTALLTTEREGVRSHRTLRAHLHAADGRRCPSPRTTSRTSTSRWCW